jgi:hypothetical protein
MLAFIQVIVSGVLAGAARWTGWSWYGLNSYTYTYAPWMGVGIVALLLGLLSEFTSLPLVSKHRRPCIHAVQHPSRHWPCTARLTCTPALPAVGPHLQHALNIAADPAVPHAVPLSCCAALAVSIFVLLLVLLRGWRQAAQSRFSAHPKWSQSSLAKNHPQFFASYTFDMLMDVIFVGIWLVLLIASAAVAGVSTAVLSALLMLAMGTGCGLSWKLRQLQGASSEHLPKSTAPATEKEATPAV